MRTIIITGGNDGLGFALAKLLSKDNNVYILARNEETLKRASQELNCKYKVCDVSNWQQVQKIVDEIKTEALTIDILVNNAGLWIQGPLQENDPGIIKAVIDVNTTGTIFMTKATVPLMKSQKSGTILNVISQSGLSAKEERAVYHASKWAITGFTKSMFLELAKDNIRVMGFYPGGMATDFFEKAGYTKDKSKLLNVNEVAKTIEFMLNQSEDIVLPEVGILSTKY